MNMLDSLWVTTSAFLVFFMHAGFALVESGLCRRKNAVAILLKNVSVVAIASLTYYAFGFAFMFGDGNAWLGLQGFFPQGREPVFQAAPQSMPLFVFLFFQLVFAATAATIISGAVAERVKLLPFLIVTTIASAFIYPLVGHWIWGGGYLALRGFHDFAGSCAVHAVGGAMGLAGAVIIGARRGKYSDDGRVHPMPAHNFPLAALGVLILWLGWFGFNGGSTLSANPEAIAPVILVTNLSAAAGFLMALMHVKWRTGMLDLSIALNGALAGLVAITAGADVIQPGAAIVLGALAGSLVVESVILLDRLRIDDPVGAIPVHLGAGALGTLAVGVLANTSSTKGILYGGSWATLGIQSVGLLMSVTVAGLSAALVWFALKLSFPSGIRVSKQQELEGLDISECGVEAYAQLSIPPAIKSDPSAPHKEATDAS